MSSAQSATVPPFVHLDNMRGGRSGLDPFDLLPGQVAEAYNVDPYDGMWGRKRGGADSLTITGGTAFTGPMNALARWVPGTDDTAAEMWGIDSAATPIWKRLAAGTAFTNVTVDDPITSRAQDVCFAALNGKLYVTYKSAAARMHVYDPNLAAPRVRRVGIAPGTNAPTVADAGVGAYAATLRYYRVRWIQWDGAAKIYRRSEPTPAVTFTPSGAGAAARVTRPTPPGEGETHWELEVSLDGITYYGLFWYGWVASPIGWRPAQPIATTNSDDSQLTTNYSSGPLSDPSGYYTLPHSAKFLVTDGNRLIWAGDFDGVQPGSRVWFSPVLNSADKGDDERWVLTNFQKNYIDLGTKDGGDITGMSYPINGVIYVFKTKAIYGLFPTSNVNGPYVFRKIRDDIGCGDHKTIITSKDISGKVVIMWWDQQTGPWRVSAQNGFEYIGRDVEDVTKRVNLGATNRMAHAVWHSAIHQWWVWLAVDGGNDPSVKLVFDPHQLQTDQEGLLRGGWYYHDGDSAAARCSCLFANTIGATMSRDLKPYVGLTNGAAKVYKCDSNTATDDGGTAFQAYWDSAPLFPPLLNGVKLDIGEPIVAAKASAATVKITIEGDFGADGKSTSGLVSLAAAGAETRVFRKFGDVALADLTCLQVRLGDSVAVASAWTIDRVSIPVTNSGTF